MPMSKIEKKTVLNGFNDYLHKCASQDALHMHLAGSGAVLELEEKLKFFYKMQYALCVSNATTGLMAVAIALDLKNTEFITSPLTYGASISSWLMLGNKPVFADIDSHTLTLNPAKLSPLITPQTKAILSIDLFGTPGDSAAIRKVADEFGLWYIADAAQSLGAKRGGLPASAFADALVVSFTTGKSIFAGEGGAILTNNTELYQKLIWYTQHPYRQHRDLGLHLQNEFSLNTRIHPLAAIWANSIFESTLKHLKQYQRECFGIIKVLNSIGLTKPICFEKENIFPTFFRLTAAWNNRVQVKNLLGELKKQGYRLKIEPIPVQLIYWQPAFLAQYSESFNMKDQCIYAERQSQIRFVLKTKN